MNVTLIEKIMAGIIVLVIAFSVNIYLCNNSTERQDRPKTYGVITVSGLLAAFDKTANAALIQERYLGTSWIITGYISTIDKNGDYIVITEGKHSHRGVGCLLDKTDKSQMDFLFNSRNGDVIKVYGTITAIDERSGCVVAVDKFEL